MSLLLKTVLVWAISSAFVRIMGALGLAFVTHYALTDLIASMISSLQNATNNIAVDLLAILSMFGIFEAMSIIGAAFVSVAAFKSAKVVLGVSS